MQFSFQQSMAYAAGHQSDVDVVQWHSNSHYIATGSSDRSIRLWDVRDSSTARVFVGHRSPVSPHAAPLPKPHLLGDLQHISCGRATVGDLKACPVHSWLTGCMFYSAA